MRPVRLPSSFLCLAVLVASVVAAAAAPAPPARVEVSPDLVRLVVDFPAPAFEPGPGGERVLVGDLPLRALRPGTPLLPEATYTVVLPPGREVERVEVLGEPRSVAGRHDLAWGREPRPICRPGDDDTPRDEAVYGGTAPWPAEPVTLAGEGWFRGWRLASLLVHPVRVRPATGRVESWGRMTVLLHLRPAAKEADHLPPRGLPIDYDELGRIAVNPATALEYPLPTKASTRVSEPYMIICPESLRDAWQRLLDHRAAHGMPGRILTVEEIEANYPGSDLPEKMREAIREAYQERGTTFVLLGGDDQDGSTRLVPYRGCLLDAGGYRYTDAPSDYYFGGLDGNWNDDGDDVWCEPDEIDYYSEVHVGRATVDTVTEVNRFIDKVILYEGGLPDDRRRDLVFMGESLDSATWGGDSKDEIAELIPGDEYEIERLYDRDGTFSSQAVKDALNRGPHLTNHLGHSNDGYVQGLYRSDVDNLHNETPFFSYSQGCDAGAFDEKFSGSSEAVSEHYILAEHAAFGVVMNVRYGWYESGSTHGPSQYLDYEFYDALFTENLETLGEANDDSRYDNAPVAQTDEYRRWCFLETNLHGDPATPVQVGAQLRHVDHRVIEDDPRYGNADGNPDPGETIRLAVTLENRRDNAATDVEAWLSSSTPGVTVHDDHATWEDIPGHEQRENLPPHFTVTLDVPCGTYARFTLEVRHDDGKIDRSSFSVLVGTRIHDVLFADTFDEDLGWTVTGTCSDGAWERGTPRGTTSGGEQANPDEDSDDDGDSCWVTGNQGLSATDDDLDDGTTILTSPPLDASTYLDLRLSWARWLYLLPETTPPSNYLKVEVSDDDGASWHELEKTVTKETPWVRRSASLEDVISLGPGLRVRFVAEEIPGAASDPVVEAAVDDVRLEGTRAECGEYAPGEERPPLPVGNTLLVTRPDPDVRLAWQDPGEDAGHDPALFYVVQHSGQPDGGFEDAAEVTRTEWIDRDQGRFGGNWFYLVRARNRGGDETP